MKSTSRQRASRTSRSRGRRTGPRAAAPWSVRPVLEGLEDRSVPSTLTVSNLNDAGVGSLRYELSQAQDGDTIVFANRLSGTITLTSGELKVGANVTIQAPGEDGVVVDGNQASRVFEILGGANVTMSGLTVTGGVANPTGSAGLVGQGGGIFVDRGATLTLTDARVAGNTANAASLASGPATTVLGSGGGIFNAGTLTMTGDIVQCNTANAGSAMVDGSETNGIGGGVYNAGTLTMTDSEVADNTANAGATAGFSGGEGSGIYSSGTLSLTGVNVSSNVADAGAATVAQFGAANGAGGGLFIDAGTATIAGCNFADDTANSASASASDPQLSAVLIQGAGGGIFNQGRLTVSDTVFSADVANSGSASAHSRAEVDGYGGAIDNFYGEVTATGVAMIDNTANAGSATAARLHRTLVVGYGGGLYGGGTMTVDSSYLFGNTANSGSTGGEIQAGGGAIFDQSPLTLTKSLVMANVANSGSGAVELNAFGGGISAAGGTISDSIFALNVVNAGSGIGLIYVSGGGIHDTGSMTVTNTIVAFNDVNTDPSSGQAFDINPSYSVGGGIDADRGTVTLNNSSVAGNFALNTPSDIYTHNGGQIDPASANNLIGTGGSGGLVNGVNGNVVL